MTPLEWPTVPLGAVASIQTGLAMGKMAVPTNSLVPYLRVANVQDGQVRLDDMKTVSASPSDVARYSLRRGDVLFTEGGDFDKLGRGTVWHGQIEPCLHQNHLFAVRTNPEKLIPEFLAALASSGHGRRYFRSASKQSTNLASINSTQLKAFPVLLPSLAEQRKIADILRTWDNAIESVARQVYALERAAVGVETEVFEKCHPDSQRRVTGWEGHSLAVLFSERRQVGNAGDALLSVSQSRGVVPQSAAGRKDSSSTDRSRYKLVLPGDIAYNTMRMWQGALGVVDTRGVVSPAYTVLTPQSALVDVHYAAHLFKSRHMMFDFQRYSQGLTSDTWNLKFPAFSSIRVHVPALETQRRVAATLNEFAVDRRKLERYATALRTQKRGLMQRLVTGEVRVNGEMEQGS